MSAKAYLKSLFAREMAGGAGGTVHHNRKGLSRGTTMLFKLEKRFRGARRGFSKQKNAFAGRDRAFPNRKMLSHGATGLFKTEKGFRGARRGFSKQKKALENFDEPSSN